MVEEIFAVWSKPRRGQATALFKILPLKAPVVSDEESIKKYSLMEKALLSSFRRIGIA